MSGREADATHLDGRGACGAARGAGAQPRGAALAAISGGVVAGRWDADRDRRAHLELYGDARLQLGGSVADGRGRWRRRGRASGQGAAARPRGGGWAGSAGDGKRSTRVWLWG